MTKPPPAAKKYPRSQRKRDALRVVSRTYASVNLQRPKEYWDDSLELEWGALDDYVVIKQLGKGKYGEVFEGVDKRTNATCVVKIMKPVKEHRLRREIKILRHLNGGPRIIPLLDVIRDPDTKTPCFVYELVNAMNFRDLQASVTDFDVRHYIYQLLQVRAGCAHACMHAHATLQRVYGRMDGMGAIRTMHCRGCGGRGGGGALAAIMVAADRPVTSMRRGGVSLEGANLQ
jgi:serine/threonine protein kinase